MGLQAWLSSLLLLSLLDSPGMAFISRCIVTTTPSLSTCHCQAAGQGSSIIVRGEPSRGDTLSRV
jgi:hypothetical protein